MLCNPVWRMLLDTECYITDEQVAGDLERVPDHELAKYPACYIHCYINIIR